MLERGVGRAESSVLAGHNYGRAGWGWRGPSPRWRGRRATVWLRPGEGMGIPPFGQEGCPKDAARKASWPGWEGSVLEVAYPRAAMGIQCWGYSGPMYSARGRMRRLSSSCSITWAAQPEMRLT